MLQITTLVSNAEQPRTLVYPSQLQNRVCHCIDCGLIHSFPAIEGNRKSIYVLCTRTRHLSVRSHRL